MTSRIGPYALLERLGEGGMSEVFVVQRDGARELAALKRLHVERSNDDLSKQRLYREAHLASQLAHPNIARLLDAGDEAGRFYLVYELIAGETLMSLRKRFEERNEKIPLDVIWAIALAALDALEYAHEHRDAEGHHLELVHRDITPNNLMVEYSGGVKLIDFGIARAKVDDVRTAPGILIGTMRYFSPEQAVADPVDRRADLYALGVVLFELLTGHQVIEANDMRVVLQQIVQSPLPPVKKFRPEVPDALERVLQKAAAKRAQQRYSTAKEFAAALRSAAAKASPPIIPATRERLREVMELQFAAELIRSNIRRGQASSRVQIDPQIQMPTRVAVVTPGGTRTAPLELPEAPRAEAADTTAPMSFRPVLPASSISNSIAMPRRDLRLPIGAAVLVVAVLLLLVATMRPKQNDVEIAALEEVEATTEGTPRVVSRAKIEASTEANQTPPVRKKAAEKAVVEKKTTRVESPPQKTIAPAEVRSEPYAHIRAALSKLQQEHDGVLFDETANQINAEAERLDERDRLTVTASVDNAQRAQNLEELEKAYRKLVSASQSRATQRP